MFSLRFKKASVVHSVCRHVLLKETDMRTIDMESAELLAVLLGKQTASEVATRSLADVFEGTTESTDPHPKVIAAKELVKRWLREKLERDTVFADPSAIRDYLGILLRDKEYEVFVVLYVDSKNRLIATEELFRGTLGQTSVYPREVLKQALKWNAAGVVFAHNHPSGVAEPSRADEALTQRLKQSLALVDVHVLDHFVIASGTAMSFAERGML